MNKKVRRRLALGLGLLCAGMLGACGVFSPPPSSPASPSSSAPVQAAWDPVPEAVAALADRDTDVYILSALDDQVTRDDLDVTVDIPPVYFSRFVRALIALELRPLEEGAPALDIPKPFTLAFSYEGRGYSYAFSSEKIIANGADAYPANPAALEELYQYEKEGYEGLLTQDIYYLREDMGFAPEDVASVELTSSTMGGEDRIVFTDKTSIQAAVESLGSLVVWRLDPGAPPNPKTGGASSCIFTLADGSTWRYETALPRAVDGSGAETLYGEVSSNYGSLFDPLYDGSQIGPALFPTMNGMALPACQTSLDYGGSSKEWSSVNGFLAPDVLYYTTDPVVSPGSGASCILAFRAPDGGTLRPDSLAVALWREDSLGDWRELDAPDAGGSALDLPDAEGKYYVQVRAQFPRGWAEYIFEYRVTDLPSYFWDIEFGNNEGNVTFTRQDSGLTIPGGQNRQYVEFILSLGLTLAREEAPAQSLAVQEAFSMAFDQEGKRCVFAFSPQGVTMDGKACALAHPERIADLYIPLTSENAMEGGDGLVDYGLRGFLTKETSAFSQVCPFAWEELESLTVTQERPKDYTAYDVTAALAGDLSWLDDIILAREWSEADHYWPRRFFLSYRIILTDGTVYELGEQFLKDGEPTGWYPVYSDLPQAEALIGAMSGEAVARPQRLPAALSVDDQGNITFS